ncbi:hypothetical protein [Bosea sp. 2RAB26]|uniref:hypothetical protein n=1 Tax=Bosea sp. 2RAB26 TaxID=3237476 RepID=UPI003F93161B
MRRWDLPLFALAAAGQISTTWAQHRPELKGFRRIHGTAIERLMSGKEFSDGVHWRYSFQPGGNLTEYAMSRRLDLRWFVKGDALCWQSARGEDCFEVWTSSTTLQLQPQGLGVPYEGRLSRQTR